MEAAVLPPLTVVQRKIDDEPEAAPSARVRVEGDRIVIERIVVHDPALAAFIAERYGLDGDELLAFFSGSKGFHLGLPLSLCGALLPSSDFNRIAKRLAEGLAGLAGITIDTGVFDKVR